jgi:hypothetical protein
VSDHYTISLGDGKYTVINYGDRREFLRHGEPWPAADNLRFSHVITAMVERIEELEKGIKAVIDGTVLDGRTRFFDGMRNFDPNSPDRVADWEEALRSVLEQKS